MAKREHPWETAVDTVTDFLATAPDEIVARISGGPDERKPFGADITEDDKLRYYREKFFQADGTTPNPSGREQVFQRVGIDGYAQILRALKGKPGEAPTPVIDGEDYGA